VWAIEVLAVLVIVSIAFGFAFVVSAEQNPEWSVLRDIADYCRQTYAFIADRPKLQVAVIVLGVIGGIRGLGTTACIPLLRTGSLSLASSS
jgi:hypothetical protein